MDPTANLAEQLDLANSILHDGVEGPEDSERLAELVLALHDWINKGGFLPNQWKR
jgi:hypothetical protein